MDVSGLFCAIAAGLLVSLLPLISWRQGPGTGRQLAMLIGGHATGAALLAAVVLVGQLPLGGWPFLAVAAASGAAIALNGGGYYVGVLHRGPVSVSWVVIWTAPIGTAALGWLILAEPFHPTQLLAIACFLACLGVMGWASARVRQGEGEPVGFQRGYWPWLAASLLGGVAGGFLLKYQTRVSDPGHLLSFMCVHFAAVVAAQGGLAAAARINLSTDRRTIGSAVLWAAVLFGHFVVLLTGLKRANVSQFFPVMAGVTIVAGMLWALLLRGERPSRLAYLGAALAIASIVLINLGG